HDVASADSETMLLDPNAAADLAIVIGDEQSKPNRSVNRVIAFRINSIDGSAGGESLIEAGNRGNVAGLESTNFHGARNASGGMIGSSSSLCSAEMRDLGTLTQATSSAEIENLRGTHRTIHSVAVSPRPRRALSHARNPGPMTDR